MDPSRFDSLTRAIARTGSRRWLLPQLAAASLLGVLASGKAEEADAERPSDRMKRRAKQRNRKQRNRRRRNTQNAGNGGGGNSNHTGRTSCIANGDICTRDSACCSNNCFNDQCAARVTQCGQGSAGPPCVPPAKGCAGTACCYGSVACGETCCDPSATQCNDQTGQCQGGPTCDAQTCPIGCCDESGTCLTDQTGCNGGGSPCCFGCCDSATGQCLPGVNNDQWCGKDGQQCGPCTGATQCVQGECKCTDDTCPPSSGGTCQNDQCICTDGVCQGCCLENVCHPGDQPGACAPGGDCVVCQPGWICFGTDRVCCPANTTHLCGGENLCCSTGCCGEQCC